MMGGAVGDAKDNTVIMGRLEDRSLTGTYRNRRGSGEESGPEKKRVGCGNLLESPSHRGS